MPAGAISQGPAGTALWRVPVGAFSQNLMGALWGAPYKGLSA